MSTKIYNGYRVTGPEGTCPDLFELSVHLRELLTPLHRDVYTRTLAAETALLLDRNTVRAREGSSERPLNVEPQAPVFVIGNAIAASHRELANPNPDILQARHDFRCSVVFVPDPDDLRGPAYALLYTRVDAYTAAWDNIPGVEEYGYWNNSDSYPDGVTAADWEVRENVWDRVLGRHAPIERGLSWDLFGTYYPLSPRSVREELAEAMPTIEERASALARYRTPVVTIDGGSYQLRDPDDIRADIDAETARVEPLLGPLSVEDLYAFQDIDVNA